jgi:two-component system cell cycle response regulator
MLQLLVLFLGFEAADEEKLGRAFQIERPDGRKYAKATVLEKSHCHIVLVNYDNPAAVNEKDGLVNAHPHIQEVAVSRGPLPDAPAHHIRGMLIAARVLSVLDKVSVPPRVVQGLSATPHIDQVRAKLPDTRAEPAQVEPKPSPAIISAPASRSSAGFRALVVDDSRSIQKSLELHLSTLPQIGGIDFADSGEAALEKTEGSHYDLIFLDIMMPGIDGYETCTLIRKKPGYKKTPIIMVSGKTSPLDEVKGVMAGCTTYLTKPVQPEAFQKLGIRVLSWLEKQKKP